MAPSVTRIESLGPYERWRLETDTAVVELLPERGALVTRFRVGDGELLDLGEETVVDATRSVRGGIPILWPNAGRLPGDSCELGGVMCRLPQHGVARNRPWTVVDSTADGEGACLRLVLTDDDATRDAFPFAFRLGFDLRLQQAALTLTLTVTNTGDRPLPQAPGFHPYFRVPQSSKESAEVETDATTARDNLTGRPVAVGTPDFTRDELDWHLDDHMLPGTLLRRTPLRPIRLTWADGFDTLVLWTLGGRDFICVEPWAAPAGALAEGGGRVVAPGESASWSWSVSV